MSLWLPSLAELRDSQAELQRFRARVAIVQLLVLACFLLLLVRLSYLQIVRHEDLLEQAENNRTAVIPTVPTRGAILDRNGVVLASNYSAYTLEITPSKVADLEATIDALAEVVDIQGKDRRRFKRLREDSRSFDSLPIRTRLNDEEVARFSAQRYRFPGVEIKARLFRQYPYGELASHVVGYIGRINAKEKERIEEDDDVGNYRGTEYIGKLGVEQRYERELHGITGVNRVETSAGGRATRSLSSHLATPGQNVVLSIDIQLQKMVEDLFGSRRGALVALDPNTGEVLAFVSKPTFDPNLFVDGIDVDNWKMLNESIDKPLLNRALRGTYPPGSTYKPFMAMAALTTGKRSASTVKGPAWATAILATAKPADHRIRKTTGAAISQRGRWVMSAVWRADPAKASRLDAGRFRSSCRQPYKGSHTHAHSDHSCCRSACRPGLCPRPCHRRRHQSRCFGQHHSGQHDQLWPLCRVLCRRRHRQGRRLHRRLGDRRRYHVLDL